MMKSITAMTGPLVAGLLVSGGAFLPGDAAAQTATNLICNGCVGKRDIGKKAVRPRHIYKNSVRSRHIKKKAVRSKHIKNGQVKAKDLHKKAKPAAANFSSVSGADFDPLPTSDTVVASVTMKLPAPGVVILNAQGFALFNDNPSSTLCAITKTTSTAGEPYVISQNHNVGNARRMPTPASRGFIESSGGNRTYNFVCRTHLGSTDMNNAILTAVYVPKRSGPAPASGTTEASAGDDID